MGNRQCNRMIEAINSLFSDIRELGFDHDPLADTELKLVKSLGGQHHILIEYDGAGYEYLNHASPLDSRTRLEELADGQGFTLEDRNKWSCVLYLE